MSDASKKPLGMAWYKYLIYFALFAGAFINFIYGINYITGDIYLVQTNGQITADTAYAAYGPVLKTVDVMYGLFLIGFAVLAIVLRSKLANYAPETLRYIQVFYSLTAGAPFVYAEIVAAITSQPVTVEAYLSLIVGLILLLLNDKYFKKRKHLFVGRTDAVQHSTQTSPPDACNGYVDENAAPLVGDTVSSSASSLSSCCLSYADEKPRNPSRFDVYGKDILVATPATVQTTDHKTVSESIYAAEKKPILFCRNCGNELATGSAYCNKCGTNVSSNTTKPPKVQKPKKPANKKLVICFTVIPIALIIIALLVVFFLIPYLEYNHAMNLLESGNYDLAYSAFLDLDGYSNSEDMLLECRYVQAVKYRDAGNYELANKLFESLGDYRDSKILIHKHDYKISNIVAATCTKAGSETYKCTGCESTYVEPITLTHSYVLSASESASCQKEGYKTYRCSLCDDEYTEKQGKTPHNTVVTSTQEATCTRSGTKYYKCSTCGYAFSEEIAQKAHSYSVATCIKPKTCSTCGKTEGTALGHSDSGIKCSRCGEITFKTLSYSGTGSKVIDYSLPNGKFKITVTMTSGDGAVDVKVHYTNSYGSDTYKWFYVINAGDSEVENISGSATDGSIVINAYSNYSGNSGWRVKIEAVEN